MQTCRHVQIHIQVQVYKDVQIHKQPQVHAHAPIHKKANQQEVENEVATIDQENTMEKVQFLFYNMTTKSIPVSMPIICQHEEHRA